MILPSQRHLFGMPRDVCYLNAAYMTPQTIRMEEVGDWSLRLKSRPWELAPADFFTEVEKLRSVFARLIDASADDIAITPSASYGLAIAAKNLKPAKDSRILLLEEQFPSNVYPWMRVAEQSGAKLEFVPMPSDYDMTGAVLDRIETLGDQIALAALPHHYWSNGVKVDLAAVGRACRKYGIRLALDLTQSLGAVPFSVRDVDPDYITAAAYKWLFGPYIVSYFYAAPRNQADLPIEENWINRAGSEDFAGLVHYQKEYLPGARRFDVGERANFALVPMARAALEQILDWGVVNIAETIAGHSRAIGEIFRRAGFEIIPGDKRGPHLMGALSKDPLPEDFLVKLQEHGVYLSVRGRSVRIAPHVYNDAEDIERLARAMTFL